MRTRCVICEKVVVDHRSSHLRGHGIDTFPGAVRLYFVEDVPN